MTETATITLVSGQPEQFAQALALVTAYLDDARHCHNYLLTPSLAGNNSYIISSVWDAPAHRAAAWYYFSDLFADANVVIHVTLESEMQQASVA